MKRGWKKGLEPSTFGTTIRRSNQLSYIHRLYGRVPYRDANVIHFFASAKFSDEKSQPGGKK